MLWAAPAIFTLYSFPAQLHIIWASFKKHRKAAWEWFTAWWRLNRACWSCSTEQLEAVTRISTVLQEPVYQVARRVVRETAVKPTMRDPHYWREVGRVAKAWNWGENVFRRLDANEAAHVRLREEGSTCTQMTRELAVELAYGAYKARGK